MCCGVELRRCFLFFLAADCRDVLLPLVTDQLSGQLDDHSSKPDYEACVQLLSTALDNLDRKDVVRSYCLSLHMSASKIKSEWRGQVIVVEISGQSEFNSLRGSARPLGQGLKTSNRHPYGTRSRTVVLWMQRWFSCLLEGVQESGTCGEACGQTVSMLGGGLHIEFGLRGSSLAVQQ